MQLLCYYVPSLYVSSPTIKNFAVKFTTGRLLKRGNMFQYEVNPPDLSQVMVPSWEKVLMERKILTRNDYFTHPP